MINESKFYELHNKIYVVGAHLNCLSKVILMSTYDLDYNGKKATLFLEHLNCCIE